MKWHTPSENTQENIQVQPFGTTGFSFCTRLDGNKYHLIRENVRIQAALALAIIGKDKAALPILEKAYFEVDHEMKLNILGAIGNIGTKDSFPFLIKVLQEPFLILRIAAASSIVQIINL